MPFRSPRVRARNASLRSALCGGAELAFVVLLPVTLLLQSIGDVLRHIGLVVLGEHAVGPKCTSRIEGAFGDHALPFAEEIRQQALIGDRDCTLAVGHLETDGKAVTAPNAALLHQAANADTRPRFDVFFNHVGRRIEEDDGLPERTEHQSHRERDHAERGTDEGEASLLAGHRAISRRLAFEAKSFEEIVEPPQFARIAGERTARIDDGSARLVGLAEHHVGANQSQPSLYIVAVAVQPLGKPLDHALNHGLASLGSERRRRSHLFGAWTATWSSAWIIGRGRTVDARKRASQQIDPWRIGRSSLDQRAPRRGGLRAVAVLLRCKP